MNYTLKDVLDRKPLHPKGWYLDQIVKHECLAMMAKVGDAMYRLFPAEATSERRDSTSPVQIVLTKLHSKRCGVLRRECAYFYSFPAEKTPLPHGLS